LTDAIRAGKFREDLFYRLSVVSIVLPPLRERREDVLLLAEHYLEQFGRDAGRPALHLGEQARRRLLEHDWPGNIRELRNLMERVAFLCPNDQVEAADLSFNARLVARPSEPVAPLPLAEATDSFQRLHIQQTIDQAGNNMTEAAGRLGLHRSNLYRKMRSLGMKIS
jgi:Nif-specific regulatory protein